jgi:superfamily II DNA or RNA helicase
MWHGPAAVGKTGRVDFAPSFERAQFRGEFRSYQAAVLEAVPEHLRDGRIHIVAAPGSGKTVLGLELIRRLAAPALVLSPTVVIAHQWAERFRDLFLPAGEPLDAYVSERVDRPALITTVTYQALHVAFSGLTPKAAVPDAVAPGPGSPDAPEPKTAEPTDQRAFDLLATLRAAGVRTVCLDEAHHLRREWQKTLEVFLKEIEGQVRTIALTATPPFGAERSQWERYTAVCGPIDEEIFVHQLVRQGTLCPHQDYIYLNYPTATELEAIERRRERVEGYVRQLVTDGIVDEALAAAGIDASGRRLPESVFEDADSWTALAAVAAHGGQPLRPVLVKQLSGQRAAPKLTQDLAAQAAQFLTERTEVFGDLAQRALDMAHGWQLVHQRRLQIAADQRLDAELKRSVGKLDSITRIARLERQVLGDRLRLVVLTDFIRRDHLRLVGSDKTMTAMGAVPIFETLRRALGADVPVGLVSGSLVLMPCSAVPALEDIAAQRGVAFDAKPMPGAGCAEVRFGGNNQDKVALVTEVFRRGHIRALVGTAALLGEGWDSPCVNSLILASFVGSYMLSNQMRGRAIRTDPDQPGKTADIWHLVAVEPPAKGAQAMSPSDPTRPAGSDFATVARRFDAFMGPVYGKPFIASGIRRVNVIEPPFDADGTGQVNLATERLAADRGRLATEWLGVEDEASPPPEVVEAVETPRPLPLAFAFEDYLMFAIVSGLLVWLPEQIGDALSRLSVRGDSPEVIAFFLIAAGICAALGWVFYKFGRRIVFYLMPVRTATVIGEAVLATLAQAGELSSPRAAVAVRRGMESGSVEWALIGASLRDKTIFAAAIAEVMSPIDNPSHLLVRRRIFGLGWRLAASFAAPSAVSTRGLAAVFERELKPRLGGFQVVSTRTPSGRRLLLKCRRRSYLNRNARFVERAQKVSG